ncbi:PilZ domain-containing protein [Sphingomonas sp.]|uniref:PilZ domain-containing protein n=1 Tax=Sphingomonas sp. TaxID=28214 RepID=UPI00184C9E87|nr:PilZ domain-containing protein [Sphingomonas sp.]MBA3512422.1 PilZ domain-containing protein [Sphingomonas sp.]
MSLLAHLDPLDSTANRRASPRRTLRLQALGTTSSQHAAEVAIHDLSRTGLLLETSAELAPGERIDVELPEAGRTEAKVIWSSGRFFGCKFKQPIPPAALSSAILRSPPEPADDHSDQVANALLELQTLRTQVSEMTEHLGRIIDRLAPAGKGGA